MFIAGYLFVFLVSSDIIIGKNKILEKKFQREKKASVMHQANL